MRDLNMKPCRTVSICVREENNITKLRGMEGRLNLNESATIIWEASNGLNTVKDIVNQVAQKYDHKASSEIEKDVWDIIDILAEHKFLVKNWDPIAKIPIISLDKSYSFNGRTCDVLLITSPPALVASYLTFKTQGMPPLGIAYISSTLKKHGFSTKIMDFNHDYINSETLERELIESLPKVIGISCATDTYNNAMKLADICRKFSPHSIIVVGGPHVTFEYEAAIDSGKFDIVAIGEGENTLLQICESVIRGDGDKHNINGICYREHGTTIVTPEREFIKDVDSIPFPDREGLDMRAYPVPGTILASRGCPGKCVFCAASAMSGGRYRFRSAENVLSEVNALLDMGINFINFIDDTITANRPRFAKLLELIKKNGRTFTWCCESRVDVVSKDLLQEMKNAGCIMVQFGVESSSQEALDAMNKGITTEQIRNAFVWAKEVGIQSTCCIIIGTPYDTHETISQNYDYAVELQEMGAQVVFSISTPYPGTKMYINRDNLGLEIVENNFNFYNTNTAIYNTKYLARNEISNYFALAITYMLNHAKDPSTLKYFERLTVSAQKVLVNNLLWE